MIKPYGPALLNCLKQNEKYQFRGLKRDTPGNEQVQYAEFQGLARDVSIPWHQIYYANYICEKKGSRDIKLLRWLVVHILYQSGSGHLRSDFTDFNETLNKWFFIEKEYFPGTEGDFKDKTVQIDEVKASLVESYHDLIEGNPRLFGRESSNTPFIYFDDKEVVYIRKYFKMEKNLLKNLEMFSLDGEEREINGALEKIQQLADELNQSGDFHLTEKTVETAAKVLTNKLVILSGGPGTGKTTTVTAILRVLKIMEQKSILNHAPRVRLAAPTGRAANRMIESIRSEMKINPFGDVDYTLPEKAYTLHKLLGINPVRKSVLYCKERPIPADLIILDEASMVDARMMALLFNALAPTATLLLVGDKDQLPSVDAGAVFGDMVFNGELPGHKLKSNIVLLTKSWRSTSEILSVAKNVINGEGEKALEQLKNDNVDILYNSLPPVGTLVSLIIDKYNVRSFAGPGKRYFSRRDPESVDLKLVENVFTSYERFAVLIPSRRGNYGVERINLLINQAVSGRDQILYHGQPIMIRINDYNLNLFNGDRGVFLNFGGEYYAVFRDGPDNFRFIPAGKLNSYETAYVQTIHKSQGSEFGEVMVLIPEGSERLLTREIIYTGITRARNKLTLFSSDQIFLDAVSREVIRHSGIREFLGGHNG